MKLGAVLIFAALLTYHTPVSAQMLVYDSVPCTEDCSGHEAGYNWAKSKNITDPKQCGGNTNSFNEGCRVWVELQMLSKQLEDKDKTQAPKSAQ